MNILVTGATGYIGGAVAHALVRAGHDVSGLARSGASADRLRRAGLSAVAGDFADATSLAAATADVDAIVSTASVGSLGGDAATFAQDRAAVRALLDAIEGTGKTFVFTSGSAVLGVFGNGDATPHVFGEDAAMPLPAAVYAPANAHVPPMLAEAFGAAMAARVATEQDVLSARGVRGIVIRPSLVYGAGGI
jgi:nucleoside-diphosphate-sugar epimerase